MKRVHYILAVHCMTGVLACECASGQPYTSATVSGDAYSGTYSQSNGGAANGNTSGDYSSGFSIWGSQAQADSTYGLNSLYAQTSYTYASGYGNPAYGQNPKALSAYALDWSIVGGYSSGTIINAQLGLGGAFNGLYTGNLTFVYGTPYAIESVLTVNTSLNSYAKAQGQSGWDDTFTFVGQPNGTVGTATFTVALKGSIFEQDTQYTQSAYTYDGVKLIADFTSGAEMSSISLPANTSIEAASGTIYGVPEPSTIALICMGLCGFWLYRRETARIAVAKARVNDQEARRRFRS